MTTIPDWLQLPAGAIAADVVEVAVGKATGGHEDSAAIARYVVQALTVTGHLPAGPPIVEHALGYKGGDMQLRWPGAERIYPLGEWNPDQQQHGGKVYTRTVIVVEDWTEVPQ